VDDGYSSRILAACSCGVLTTSLKIQADLYAEDLELFSEGIRYAHDVIDGTAAILILKDDGSIIAARDKLGRLPVLVSKNDEGRCVSLESFACHKFGYESEKELGPGEIVEFTADKLTVLSPAHKEMKMCAFMWTYYGYPASTYEGVNVELMRYQNGKSMAEHDKKHGTLPDIDYVCGIPDSGVPHAIGYSAECGLPFSRPLVKYTPTWSRSFVPQNQSERSKIAKMKQLPVYELIRDKKLLFIDDSIVRGTQLRETVNFLFESGAREMHIRSASPPLMYRCKYLNFTRAVDDMELIARRTIHELEGDEGIKYLDEYSNPTTERGKKMREAICKKFNFTSLEFQTLEGMIKAIGMDPSKLCTYCWNGKE